MGRVREITSLTIPEVDRINDQLNAYAIKNGYRYFTEHIELIFRERHQSILEQTGLCINCGSEHNGIEPDTDGARCQKCHTLSVSTIMTLWCASTLGE